MLLALVFLASFTIGFLLAALIMRPSRSGELWRQSTQTDTGLRCLWCGKRIGAGRFCTGTHYNLFIARYAKQEGRRCDVVEDHEEQVLSPHARLFDELNRHWTSTPEYNRIFLNTMQRWANDKLHSQGFVFLNEVYEALGIEKTQVGQEVGWKLDTEGKGFVDFGISEDASILNFSGLGPITIDEEGEQDAVHENSPGGEQGEVPV